MDLVLYHATPIQMYKGLNSVMSVISLGIGIFSHCQSYWVKLDRYQICYMGIIEPMNFLNSCPDIAWERVFVSVIIICYILSWINFLLEFIKFNDLNNKLYKVGDAAYHIVASIALIIAGVLYTMSALLIYDVLNLENSPVKYHYRTVEKLLSAVWVFLQSICYAATAYQLRKEYKFQL